MTMATAMPLLGTSKDAERMDWPCPYLMNGHRKAEVPRGRGMPRSTSIRPAWGSGRLRLNNCRLRQFSARMFPRRPPLGQSGVSRAIPDFIWCERATRTLPRPSLSATRSQLRSKSLWPNPQHDVAIRANRSFAISITTACSFARTVFAASSLVD